MTKLYVRNVPEKFAKAVYLTKVFLCCTKLLFIFLNFSIEIILNFLIQVFEVIHNLTYLYYVIFQVVISIYRNKLNLSR